MVRAAAAIALAVFFFLAALFFLHAWEENMDAARGGPAAAPEEALTSYDGGWYRPRRGLETVLAIGVDQPPADHAPHGDRKYGQADFLLLLVIDKRNERCTAVHINCCAMTEIRTLDGGTNEPLGTAVGRLSLAHTCGNSPEACCENTAAAVSGLLCGVGIDHYLSLTMDGAAALNDLAGGVTLEVMDGLTGLEDPGGLHRMELQKQYLGALQEQLLSRAAADKGFTMSALLELNAYMVSDCTVEQLSRLADTLEAYGVAEYRTLEGKPAAGGNCAEYYVDEAAVRELVMELFYEQAEPG